MTTPSSARPRHQGEAGGTAGPEPPRRPRRPVHKLSPRAGFGARLLFAQALVLTACAVTAWLVAGSVGPGIFRLHLRRAGIPHSRAETRHVEEAFGSAMLLSLSIALLAAVVGALAVSWYFTRRVQGSIAAVSGAAADIVAGDYGSRLPREGLGAEFDQLTATVNQLAERLGGVESNRRRMLADLAHEMRTPLATVEAHLEAVEDGVRELDESTLAGIRSSTGRLGRLARDMAAVSQAQEGNFAVDRRPVVPVEVAQAAITPPAAGSRRARSRCVPNWRPTRRSFWAPDASARCSATCSTTRCGTRRRVAR